MAALKYWLWLTSRKGIDSAAALTVLDHFLTPERAYRVDLLAGYTTPSDGEIYNVFSSAEEMQAVLSRIMEDSSFCPAEIPEDIQNIVTLSTCTYEYNTARYVVIGNLVPAEYLPQEELDRIMAYSE